MRSRSISVDLRNRKGSRRTDGGYGTAFFLTPDSNAPSEPYHPELYPSAVSVQVPSLIADIWQVNLGIADRPLSHADVLWPGEKIPTPKRSRHKARALKL